MSKDYIENNTIQSNPKKKKNKIKINKTAIFIFLMLFYPLFHFCLMWFGVNINSILLTFKYVPLGESQLEWVPSNDLFHNYKNIFAEFKIMFQLIAHHYRHRVEAVPFVANCTKRIYAEMIVGTVIQCT